MLTLTSPCCFFQYFSPLPPTHSLFRSAQTRGCAFAHSSWSLHQGKTRPVVTLYFRLEEAPPCFASSITAEQRAKLRFRLCCRDRHRQQRDHGSNPSFPAELGQPARWKRVRCRAELIWSKSDEGSTENGAGAPVCHAAAQTPPQEPQAQLCQAPDLSASFPTELVSQAHGWVSNPSHLSEKHFSKAKMQKQQL